MNYLNSNYYKILLPNATMETKKLKEITLVFGVSWYYHIYEISTFEKKQDLTITDL